MKRLISLSIALLMLLSLSCGCAGLGALFPGKDDSSSADSLPWVSAPISSYSIPSGAQSSATESEQSSSQSSSSQSSSYEADYDEVSIWYKGTEYVVHLGTVDTRNGTDTTVWLLGSDIANVIVIDGSDQTLPVHMIIVVDGVEYEWASADVNDSGYNFIFEGVIDPPELIYIYPGGEKGNTGTYFTLDPVSKRLMH